MPAPTAETWLRFHAGCPIAAAPANAAFVLACGTPPALAGLAQGTEEEPHRSATLVIQVANPSAPFSPICTATWTT